LSGLDHDVRVIAVMRLPASHVGKSRFAAGDVITLRSELCTHGRMHRSTWNGDLTLAK
jgi:hypothetical protein